MTIHFIKLKDDTVKYDFSWDKDSENIEIADVKIGDCVIGCLSFDEIKMVIEAGARYYHLMKSGDRLVPQEVKLGNRWPRPYRLDLWTYCEKAFDRIVMNLNSFRHIIIVPLCLLLFPILVNTFSSVLYKYIFENELSKFTICSIFILFFICFIPLIILYRMRGSIFNFSTSINKKNKNEARKVLIMALSECGEDKRKILKNYIESSNFEPDDPFNKECFERISWIQNIRAMRYNKEKLERIFVMSSETTYNYYKDFFDILKILIAKEGFNDVKIDLCNKNLKTNFNDFDSIGHAFNVAIAYIKDLNYKNDDICIDITSGTKNFSVVGAVRSCNNGMRFLYTKNDGISESYEARFSLADAFGSIG